jgi:hypothetical protein
MLNPISAANNPSSMARRRPCHHVWAPEYQQDIRARETGDEDRRLHIHLPTVALPLAGGSKMLFDTPPERALEGMILTELEAPCRFCGSKGLARRDRVDLLLVCHRTILRLRVGVVVSEVTLRLHEEVDLSQDAVLVTRSPLSLEQSGRAGGVRSGKRCLPACESDHD